MARLKAVGADDPYVVERIKAAYAQADRIVDLDKPQKPRMTTAEALKRLMETPPPETKK